MAAHYNVSDLDTPILWLGIRVWLELCKNPEDEEAKLKEKYKALHNKLLALVKQ